MGNVITDNPDAVKEFMEKKPEKLEAGAKILATFKKNLPDISDDHLERTLCSFAGFLGILSEQPEVILGIVDAYTILLNGEEIMLAAACQVRR